MTESSLAAPLSPAPPRARWWVYALWVVAAVVITGLSIHYDGPLEEAYDRVTERSQLLMTLGIVLSQVFSIVPIALGTLLLALLDRRLRWRFAYDVAVVMVAQMLASTVVKQLSGRPRPPGCNEDPCVFYGPNLKLFNASFPSGHATGAFALAVILSLYYPRWRWLFYVLATAVCLARVQLDRHFISDVVAGAFLGYFVASLLLPFLHRDRAAPGPSAVSPTEG